MSMISSNGNKPESAVLSARIQRTCNDLLMLSEAGTSGQVHIHRAKDETGRKRSTSPTQHSLDPFGGSEDQYFVGFQGDREASLRDLAEALGLPRQASWGWMLDTLQRRLWTLASLDELAAARLEKWCDETEALVQRVKVAPDMPDRPTFACPQCERRFHPGRKDQVYCGESDCTTERARIRKQQERDAA